MEIKRCYETYTIDRAQDGGLITLVSVREYGLAGKIYLMTVPEKEYAADDLPPIQYFERINDRLVPLNQEQSQMLHAEFEKDPDYSNLKSFVTLQFDQDHGPLCFEEHVSYSVEVEGETKYFVALYNVADDLDTRVVFMCKDKDGVHNFEEIPEQYEDQAKDTLLFFTQSRRASLA